MPGRLGWPCRQAAIHDVISLWPYLEDQLFGDTVERVVKWATGDEVSSIAEKPVRLRFALVDADFYSFRLREP